MEKNLRDRLITVSLGLPIVFVMIFLVPQYNYIAFSLFCILIAFLGSIEMSRLLFKRIVPIALISSLIPIVQYIQGVFGFNENIPDLLFVLILLLSFMIEIKVGESDNFKGSLQRCAKNALLVIYPSYLLSFFLKFLALDSLTSYAVAFFFVLVFGNDIFAYVWGRLFGKGNSGIIKVSPKKSVAGFIGSFLSTIALSFGYYALCRNYLPYISVPFRILLGASISIVANLGDLVESVFKRSAGVKDSGNIFPGRGGALDSLDSAIASSPIFFIIFKLILETV